MTTLPSGFSRTMSRASQRETLARMVAEHRANSSKATPLEQAYFGRKSFRVS